MKPSSRRSQGTAVNTSTSPPDPLPHRLVRAADPRRACCRSSGWTRSRVITGLQSLWESDAALALLVTFLAIFAPYAKTIGLALLHFDLLSPKLLPALRHPGQAGDGRHLPDRALHRHRQGRGLRHHRDRLGPLPLHRLHPGLDPCPSWPSAPADPHLRAAAEWQIPPFTCTVCGAAYRKWAGKCDACGGWNTIVEEAPLSTGPKSLGAKGRRHPATDLATEEAPPPRASSGIDELDRVLGGGLVPASAILVGGDPGIGKSTLLLQAAASFAPQGSEMPLHLRRRSRRASPDARAASGPHGCAGQLAAETNLRDILTTLDAERPQLAIIDSIQTMWLDRVEAPPAPSPRSAPPRMSWSPSPSAAASR